MRGFNLHSPILSNPQKYTTSRFLNLRMKYRSSFEVIASILETTREYGTGQYAIITRSGITYSQFKKYSSSLTELGFIETVAESGRALYRISEKGLRFLNQYQVLLEMLSTAFPDDGMATITCDLKRQTQVPPSPATQWMR
jgi:predicted transcriptional regulator